MKFRAIFLLIFSFVASTAFASDIDGMSEDEAGSFLIDAVSFQETCPFWTSPKLDNLRDLNNTEAFNQNFREALPYEETLNLADFKPADVGVKPNSGKKKDV